MICVRRWSETVCWKMAFSPSRLSEACFICFCISAISASVASILPCSISIVLLRSAAFVWSLSFVWCASSADLLFALSSLMHQSRCATSSSCSFFSCTTILSISSRTFEKESRRAWVASNARPGECERPAASASTEAARPLRARSCAELPLLEVWRKAAFMVLSRTLRALSSSRILTVPSTALISASRLLTRASNSAPLSLHFCLRVARKARSSSSCFLVSSSSLAACTCFSPKSAYSSSSCTTSFLPAAISSSLAAFTDTKSFTAFSSSFWMLAKLFCQGCFICFRRPKIWPLWDV
mmetsp:Transcript_42262/g.127969  ORF Transcript_42262/g.127969 Transcript_42262/m.127969 type:complete len:297 (-) Transcript_42262:331-1221(-)